VTEGVTDGGSDGVMPGQLLHMARRTLRMEPGRVLVPAVVVFGIDAIANTELTEISANHHGFESLIAFTVLGLSALGLTFYSGLLERMVGAVERNQPAPGVRQVMRSTPYLRLLVADGILWVLSAVADLAFVIPGIIVTTLFALIGPLINMEDIGVRAAFRRSAQLVRPRFLLVLCMITLPLAAEHEAVDSIKLVVPHEQLALVVLTHFLLGFLFGVALGLVEVALAERLVNGARGPGASIRPGAPIRPGASSHAPLPSAAHSADATDSTDAIDSTAQPAEGGVELETEGGRHGRDDSRDGHAGAGTVPPTG
jgi:hypothetical protein